MRNVPDETIAALKRRADAQGRSMEAEHRAYLNELQRPPLSAFLAEADRLRAETRGRGGLTSVEILREDRDSH